MRYEELSQRAKVNAIYDVWYFAKRTERIIIKNEDDVKSFLKRHPLTFDENGYMVNTIDTSFIWR